MLDPTTRPCGHPRSDQRRTKPGSCGTCHRESQKRRYRAAPALHREKALAWQAVNRETVNHKLRRFREQNPGYDAARRYSPDAETREWLVIIRGDPCAYCGAAMEQVDHIDPVSRGGPNHWTNFAPACGRCNASKHDSALLSWLLHRAS